ncbi:MAG: tetratricopeptide repeat protein [Verrucomicrobiota bacterium]
MNRCLLLFLRLILICIVLPGFGGKVIAQDASSAEDPAWLAELKTKATAGDATAQKKLGDLYRTGQGGFTPFLLQRAPVDLAEAAKWYAMAAEQGNAAAQYHYAIALIEGRGVEKDANAGVPWLFKAAEGGEAEAQAQIGEWFLSMEGKAEMAIDWLRKAAAQDHAQAMFFLAKELHTGERTAKSVPEAVTWYEKVAAKDVVIGKMALAKIYDEGADGVPANRDLAMRWYQRSLGHNNKESGEATQRLAELLGNAPEESNVPFLILQRLYPLARAGNVEAMFELGVTLVVGTKIVEDREEGLKWMQASAFAGNVKAQNELAAIHMGGFPGFEVEPDKALPWAKMSAKAGHQVGIYHLKHHYANGLRVDKDPAKVAELDRQYDEVILKNHLADVKERARKRLYDDLPDEIEWGKGTVSFLVGEEGQVSEVGIEEPANDPWDEVARKWVNECLTEKKMPEFGGDLRSEFPTKIELEVSFDLFEEHERRLELTKVFVAASAGELRNLKAKVILAEGENMEKPMEEENYFYWGYSYPSHNGTRKSEENKFFNGYVILGVYRDRKRAFLRYGHHRRDFKPDWEYDFNRKLSPGLAAASDLATVEYKTEGRPDSFSGEHITLELSVDLSYPMSNATLKRRAGELEKLIAEFFEYLEMEEAIDEHGGRWDKFEEE